MLRPETSRKQRWAPPASCHRRTSEPVAKPRQRSAADLNLMRLLSARARPTGPRSQASAVWWQCGVLFPSAVKRHVSLAVGWGEAAPALPPSCASLGAHSWDLPSTYRIRRFRSTHRTAATFRTPPWLRDRPCTWQQRCWNTSVCKRISRGAEQCGRWHLAHLPCLFKHSITLQELGTAGRTRCPLAYISAASVPASWHPWGQIKPPDTLWGQMKPT